MKVAVVDYGMGNLGSVCRALDRLGADGYIAGEPSALAIADRIVLPGVGSFSEGMDRLSKAGWPEALHREVEAGKPLLGICLGMQLLAGSGSEWGEHAGLGFVPGRVLRLDALGCEQRIPHVGWNDIRLDAAPSPLFAGVADGADFYFVHSYAFDAESADSVLARVDYGVTFVAAVGRGHVFGTQFHPEKSSRAGSRVLGNFLGYRPC